MKTTLTHHEQSATFLSLLRTWHVQPEIEDSENVSRHETARLISFHLDDAPMIMAAAKCIHLTREAMVADGAAHKYFAIDMDALIDALGNVEAARLCAGVAGYWSKTCTDTGRVEWSDSKFIGGGRNIIKIAEVR